ncbi:hypothetical protein SKa4_00203 [Pseudomonas phage vB_PpuM-SKa-4]
MRNTTMKAVKCTTCRGQGFTVDTSRSKGSMDEQIDRCYMCKGTQTVIVKIADPSPEDQADPYAALYEQDKK